MTASLCTTQRCSCRHPQQDALYGPQIRVHNPTLKSKDPKVVLVRCTVCGAERPAQS